MNEKTEPGSPAVAEAAIGEKPKFSLVWVVPIVAAIIGAWLVYKAITEEGPTITIVFETGEGLTAGKTKVKYRSVEVGTVENVELSKDLEHVVVTAKMAPGARDYLREGTRFWVVRARVTAGEVQGLGTLLSGAYIGIDPAAEGRKTRDFVGLEKAPVIETDQEGRKFRFTTRELGSLSVGAPIYYRQFSVGRILDYRLELDGTISGQMFVEAPYDQLIKETTRFWNASGVEATLGADGFHVDTQSLTSILIGGIAFDTPESLEARAEVQENHEFFIYANRLESLQREYKIQKYYVMIFNESVRGLTTGSPVEFFGLKIGEVVDISFEVDYENMTLHIPVLVRIEPERLVPTGDESRLGNESQGMVARGWRGQLATGNVLTGGKVINLVLDPDAPPGETGEWKGYPTFPTVPSSLRNLASDVGRIVDKIEDIPFDRIGENLSETLASINRIVSDPELANAIASLRRMADQLSNDVAPALDSVLNKAEETLDATRKQIDADSVTAHELRRLLMELGDTAQSIRTIVEYLERHPESLIKGKEDQS
jgi:paraquat-inducible protein B